MVDIHILVLLTLAFRVVSSAKNTCSIGLGMESGSISSSQIRATRFTSTPNLGRLNELNGSWCFNYENISESIVEFVVDLGQMRLVSGFQSQGPPPSIYDEGYTRYVGLGVDLSLDGKRWRHLPSQYYASDEPNNSNVIQTHAFNSIHTARFLKIFVSSDVRWIGHPDKCFRFEILGCPFDLSVDLDFQYSLHPEGLITATWSSPNVIDSKDQSVPLPSPYYIVRIDIDDVKSDITNFSGDASLILDRPMWDTTYVFNISCVHDNITINCGQYVIETLFMQNGSKEAILFDEPVSLQALFHDNGTLRINWVSSSKGWRSSNRIIKLLDQNKDILSAEITSENAVIYKNVSVGDYYVTFEPGGSNIPPDSQHLTVHLLIISDQENKTYAFLGSTDLTLSIIWSGSVHAQWSQCKGRRVESSNTSVIDVDEYRIFLLNDSSSVIFMEDRLTPQSGDNDSTIVFSGMSLETYYTVKIQCIIMGKVFECGDEKILTTVTHFSTLHHHQREIYVRTSFPSTWNNLNNQCRASRGHLVSLDRHGIEYSLLPLTARKDFWTGGNICHNSPAPSNSMWSDGSVNARINFASNSGLDAFHCCVKSSRNELNQSIWKGENCETILYGICEYTFSDILDNLSNIRAESPSSDSVSISWDTQGLLWQPMRYEIHLTLNMTLHNPVKIEKLTKTVINATESPVQINGLQEYSEYDVIIVASLAPQFESNKSFYSKSRTLPFKDVDYNISSTGVFQASWLKKVSLFKESENIRLNVSSDGFSSYQLVNGSALKTELHSLRFGKPYTYYIEDEQGTILGPNVFEAYPNCTNGIRNHTYCIFIPSKNLTYAQRNEECRDHGFSSNSILSDAQLTHFQLWNDFNKNTLFWIQSNGSSFENKNRSLCRAWSRFLKLYTFTDCEEKLPILCFGDLPIEFETPSKRDLKITSGPTHITIDWNTSQKGWYINYTVSYMDEMIPSNRSKRTTILEPPIRVHKPPINITGLLPKRSYSVTVLSSLDKNTIRTLTVEGVSTTSDMRMSREIGKILTAPKKDVHYAQISLISICFVITFISIILLSWSRTMSLYPENLVQLCFQLSNLCFYISFALFSREGPLGIESQSQMNCLIGIFVFNYLYMCGSIFLLLESMIIMHQLVDSILLPYLSQNISVFVFLGFGLPLIYVISAVLALSDHLVPTKQSLCWMNLDVMESSVFYAPMAVLILLTIFFALVSLCGSSKERRAQLSPGEATRLRTLSCIRHAIFFIALFYSSTWITGITFAHFDKKELLYFFLTAHVFVSVIVLFFRIFYDREIMTRIKRTRMSPSEVEEQYLKECQNGNESRKASGTSKKSVLHHNRSLSSNSIITPVESNDNIRGSSHPLNSASTTRHRPMSVASISERIPEEQGESSQS